VHYTHSDAPRPPEQKACMCECTATGCLSTALHTCSGHTTMDGPVRVGKGREEASSLLYCLDFELIFVYSPCAVVKHFSNVDS